MDLFSSHTAPPAAAPPHVMPAPIYGAMDPGLASLGYGGMPQGVVHPPATGGHGGYGMPQALGGYGAPSGMPLLPQPGMPPMGGYGMHPGMTMPGMMPQPGGLYPGISGQPYGGTQPHDLGGLLQGMQISAPLQPPAAAAARPLPLSALGKMGSGADFSL